MADELDYTGKVALITGGTKGIGKTIVATFAARGASVVTCGRNPPEPGVLPDGTEFVAADVRDPDSVAALVDGIVDRHGAIDVVINNAGGSPFAWAATASPRYSTSIIALNLLAPLHVSQRANIYMQKGDGGSIVNISSVSAHRPTPGTAAYGAAKAGLESLTVTLASEWAPKVRVNCILSGLIRTESSHLHYGDEAGVAAVGKQVVPIGRMGEPQDLADACVYLCSPLAKFVTGAIVPVHGGGELPAYMATGNATEGH